jgi:hypothetical protein
VTAADAIDALQAIERLFFTLDGKPMDDGAIARKYGHNAVPVARQLRRVLREAGASA